MKALSLLLMRIGTGLLLMIWGAIKIMAPEVAIGVSDKYYGSVVSQDMLQMPWGLLQVVVGLAVVLGIFRKIVYKVS